jgi:hypothetical protein
MTLPRAIFTGVLTGLCLATYAQAADFREEPYAALETQDYGRIIEVPQERPLPRRFHEERTYRSPRYVEEEPSYGPQARRWPFWGRPVAARPWRGPSEECRLIIKRRVNPWGETTVRRLQICD